MANDEGLIRLVRLLDQMPDFLYVGFGSKALDRFLQRHRRNGQLGDVVGGELEKFEVGHVNGFACV